MVYGLFSYRWLTAAVGCMALGAGSCGAQREEHGRNYKPLPPMVHVQITVLKDFNGKPFPNAGVVFHAVRNGRNDGNLEVKTDPDGRATIDVIEQGSHVTLQVIARGYATYATEFDAEGEEKAFTVRLQRPRAQVSVYEDNEGKAAQVKPGVQEHHAASYGLHQSQCNTWLHLLLRLLHRNLAAAGQLPERDARKLKRVLKGLKQVFIDGTERAIERPGDSGAQRSHYSGKKKGMK